LFGLVACTSSSSYVLTPDPTPYYDTSPSEYYLYLPSSYTPEKDWPVLVGVHSYSGDGRQCLDWWKDHAESAGFVLVCPSFGAGNGDWEFIQIETNLLGILRHVRNEVRVQKKVFLMGFSAGAEFVQLFSYAHPELVRAVSLLSAGNYHDPYKDFSAIPFLVVIGDRDNLVAQSSACSFVEVLGQKGYTVEFVVLPAIGHEVTPEALERTIAFFQTFTK
jgi:dipeptidyl aminopeptidase/acylaminoacyl peptidase